MPSLLPNTQAAIRSIPPDVARLLHSSGIEMQFAAGQLIHQAGDTDRALSLILAGRVRFRRIDFDGTEVSASTVGRGRTFGEIPCLTGRPRTHDAVAETSVRLVRIRVEIILALLDREPSLRNWMMLELAHSLERVLNLLDDLNRLSATQKVARAIAAWKGDRIVLRQADLAQSLNLSRKSVSRALTTLRKAGLVLTGYGEIRVIHHKKLSDFVSRH